MEHDEMTMTLDQAMKKSQEVAAKMVEAMEVIRSPDGGYFLDHQTSVIAGAAMATVAGMALAGVSEEGFEAWIDTVRGARSAIIALRTEVPHGHA
jgi:GTP:adenosylcobinamide-phosphate guanylyltransferase